MSVLRSFDCWKLDVASKLSGRVPEYEIRAFLGQEDLYYALRGLVWLMRRYGIYDRDLIPSEDEVLKWIREQYGV